MSGKLGLVTRLAPKNAKFFTTTKARRITQAEVDKIKKQQEFHQATDEPVHLIGTGKIHFYITSALGVGVIISTMHSIYNILNHSKA